MNSQSLEERQWREQLRAMRYLPPGTPLPKPSEPESRQLLADLLALPDDVVPLRWLLAERGDLAALVALRQVLRHLGRRASGLERARVAGRDAPGDNLPTLVPITLLIEQMQVPAPSADRVRETLRALRAGRDPRQIPPANAGDEELQLLGDLLRLPATSDPLHWLVAERSDLVARATLRSVLQDARPPATRSLGRPLARRRLREGLRLRPGIRAVIDTVDFGSSGFAITINLRFSLDGTLAGEGGLRMPCWAGFDRVTDDRGYHYLLQRAEWEAGTWLRWWYRERLRMTCYPAVADGATILTFSALPATLSHRRTGSLRGPQPLPDEALGDIIWRVKIPPPVGPTNPTS